MTRLTQLPLRSRRHIAVIGIASLLPAGCARYVDRPISLSRASIAYQQRSLRDSNVVKYVTAVLKDRDAAAGRWNLDSLTVAALYFDPGLQLANAHVESVRAAETTAGARPNPTVGFTPGYNFSAVNAATPWIPGTTIDVPIETAGKRDKRWRIARLNTEAARYDYLSSVWLVRSNLHRAWIELGFATHRKKLIEEQAENEATLINLLRQRFSAGAMASTEIAPFTTAQVQFTRELVLARSAAVHATNRLADALGLPPAGLAGISIDTTPAEPVIGATQRLEVLRSAALQNRADIRSLLARYEAAQVALQLEIARQYPDVRLGSGYQWDQGESKWNLALTIELPVLNQNQGPIAEAEARRAEVGAELLERQARVANEIDSAIANLITAVEELDRVKLAAAAVENQTALTRQRFNAGGADQVEVINALMEEQNAVILTTEAQARQATAHAQAEAALQMVGAPWAVLLQAQP